jgi:hypothetical protein
MRMKSPRKTVALCRVARKRWVEVQLASRWRRPAAGRADYQEVPAAWLPGLTAAASAARIAERIGVRYDPDHCARLILRDHLK